MHARVYTGAFDCYMVKLCPTLVSHVANALSLGPIDNAYYAPKKMNRWIPRVSIYYATARF